MGENEVLTIDHGVEIPPRMSGVGSPGRWTKLLAAMLSGDSVFLTGDAKAADRLLSSVRTAATKASIKITARKADGGVRFWRV